MRFSPMLLLLLACAPVHFVDPNQPQLFRSEMQYSTTAQSEPLIWLPLIDLFDESGTNCAAAQQWTLQVIRGAMLAADRNAVQLQGALVSPDCTQAQTRTVDAAAISQQIAAAVAARPTAHVRVVLVYANNIALSVPAGVQNGLGVLRAGGSYLWTLSRAPVSTQIPADQALPWTFTWDPALQSQLAAALVPFFPLQSDGPIATGLQPILGPGDLPRARELKVCSQSPFVLFDVPADGTAVVVTPGAPPHFQLTLTRKYAVPKSQFAVQKASFEVEGCSANCNRFLSPSPGALERWDKTRGCALGAP